MTRSGPGVAFLGALILIVASGQIAGATITKSDLKKKVVVSQEAQLLQQVDTVSLYLSSSRVAFAPRLKEGLIEVETTVLDPALVAKPSKARSFVSRLIDTFIATLGERLPIYAPDVAATFDPKKDIRFIVNAGPARSPIGVWAGGGWSEGAIAAATPPPPAAATAKASTIAPAPTATAASAEEVEDAPSPKSPKGCACPARR